MADAKKLEQDLIAVLDEHSVEYLSFTVTKTKKRMHGQLQFEESFDVKQERLPMGEKAAGTTEKV